MRIQIYFFKNPSCKAKESTSYAVQQIWPELGLAGGFHSLTARLLRKTELESLNQTP